MRLNDDKMQEARDNRVRAIVREEIVKALQAFRREAERYDGGEIRDMAADALASVLDGTVVRLTCPHERYRDWGRGAQPRCAQCGEPEPEPVNPFEGPEETKPVCTVSRCGHSQELHMGEDHERGCYACWDSPSNVGWNHRLSEEGRTQGRCTCSRRPDLRKYHDLACPAYTDHRTVQERKTDGTS